MLGEALGVVLWKRLVRVLPILSGGMPVLEFDLNVPAVLGRHRTDLALGRLGLLIHSTAGFVDAGWDGHLTLELSNVANLPITVYPGMKIGQISFFQMTTPADRPYGSEGLGSKYSGQRGPTPSRYSENFKKQ